MAPILEAPVDIEAIDAGEVEVLQFGEQAPTIIMIDDELRDPDDATPLPSLTPRAPRACLGAGEGGRRDDGLREAPHVDRPRVDEHGGTDEKLQRIAKHLKG